MKPQKINKKIPQLKRLNKLNNRRFQNNKKFQNNKRKFFMKRMKLKQIKVRQNFKKK